MQIKFVVKLFRLPFFELSLVNVCVCRFDTSGNGVAKNIIIMHICTVFSSHCKALLKHFKTARVREHNI